jgi:pyruvate ferredoxin oxidoreductase gamma subunit
MRTVRFHGCGGQGAKTASRILGTASFLEGYQVQDAPIEGPNSAAVQLWHSPDR